MTVTGPGSNRDTSLPKARLRPLTQRCLLAKIAELEHVWLGSCFEFYMNRVCRDESKHASSGRTCGPSRLVACRVVNGGCLAGKRVSGMAGGAHDMVEPLPKGVSSHCPSCRVNLAADDTVGSLACPSCAAPLYAVPTTAAVWFFDATDLKPANPIPPFYQGAAVAVVDRLSTQFSGILSPYESQAGRAVVVCDVFARAVLMSADYSELRLLR